jgi:hypothetical protein
MKVANDPKDGLPVDLEEAVYQHRLQTAQPMTVVDADHDALMRSDWMDAAQVFTLMQTRGSTKEGTESSILSQASLEHDGRPVIRTRARQLIFMPAPFSNKQVERYTDRIIRVWMWWGELVSSDWGGGSFAVKTDDPYGTWTMHGVEFLSDDLKSLGLIQGDPVNVASSTQLMEKPTRAGGRKRKPEWDTFIAELALAAADGEVLPSMTETQLLKLVNDRLALREVGEMPRATVQSAIAATLSRFREDDAEEE